MTERPNPLMDRKPSGYRFERGSPEARIQLQEHCDNLNQGNGDRWWFVVKLRNDDGSERLTIDNHWRQQQRDEPRCTPAEARVILRQHGLAGSAFAKSILSALGEYDTATAKAA